MITKEIINHLLLHGVKPTANRIVIADALLKFNFPVSMKELEYKIQTIDKSSIFRTLVLFRKHHLVHQVEGGSDVIRYELCHSNSNEEDSDMHVHFYCEICQHTYCLPNIPIPRIVLPQNFKCNTINYMVKGLCPKCNKQKLEK